MINDKGIALIKKYEGCRLQAYKLPGEKYYTIGYGYSYDPSITANTVWTQAQADAALIITLQKFEKYVDELVPLKLNENQRAALVSYTYNRGKGGLKQLVNNSMTYQDYSNNIVKFWGTAERYKDALIKRRKAEKALFDTEDKITADGYQVGKTYTLQTNLYVRQSPNGAKLKFDALTNNAKDNGMFDDEGNAILFKDTRVTCKGMSGRWMQIPSGWLCAISDDGRVYIK